MPQQFIVPQFIDVENKIIGPITVRQFIIFLVGFGLIAIIFRIAQFWVAATMSVSIFGITGIFAFLKINGRPFHFLLLNMLQTVRRPTLKTWHKEISYKDIITRKKKQKRPELVITKKPVSASKLTQLSLIVDTGGAYQEEEE